MRPIKNYEWPEYSRNEHVIDRAINCVPANVSTSKDMLFEIQNPTTYYTMGVQRVEHDGCDEKISSGGS